MSSILKQQAQSTARGSKRKFASGSTKFYAVKKGRKPGVYPDWAQCQQQVVGYSGAVFKSFTNRDEALSFCGFKHETSQPSRAPPEPSSKKRSRDDAASPPPSETSTTTKKPKVDAAQKEQIIYTDGSSVSNGKRNAAAGVGVYFGPDDERNVSEPLEGRRQTNQRAELTAVLRALELGPDDLGIVIRTDSRYTIGCVTDWCKRWEVNGWVTSRGESVENTDLIKLILEKIRQRQTRNLRTDFAWVKGHNKDPGNEAADKLAVQGSLLGSLSSN